MTDTNIMHTNRLVNFEKINKDKYELLIYDDNSKKYLLSIMNIPTPKLNFEQTTGGFFEKAKMSFNFCGDIAAPIDILSFDSIEAYNAYKRSRS